MKGKMKKAAGKKGMPDEKETAKREEKDVPGMGTKTGHPKHTKYHKTCS